MSSICPICKADVEDMRHVSVECFYDVQEFVPDMIEEQIFVEVDDKNTYFGYTRKYENGMRDKFSKHDGGKTPGGTKITKIENNPEPIGPIRLLENHVFRINCCKGCRAEFLQMLADWREGKFFDKRQSRDSMTYELG